MKKRKQHYVWRHYLRSWSENEKIFCLRDGKIFESNLMGVANKRDFYRLKELNLDDIKFIKKFAIDPSPPHLQKLHYNLIKQFNSIFELKSHVDSKGIDDSKLNGEIDKAINNLEEDLHGGIESSAIKYIESILKENISFYTTDEGCRDFIYYLCVQYMRTQKIKSSVLSAVSGINSIDISKIWNVMSHIFATNMGWSLYAGRKQFRMVLLKNKSVKEFITGDQPVINTYATSVSNLTPPDKLEFYYPVSPSLAILITEKENHKESNRLALNEKDVVSYNKLIVKNCHDQIYATSISILEEYKDQ